MDYLGPKPTKATRFRPQEQTCPFANLEGAQKAISQGWFLNATQFPADRWTWRSTMTCAAFGNFNGRFFKFCSNVANRQERSLMESGKRRDSLNWIDSNGNSMLVSFWFFSSVDFLDDIDLKLSPQFFLDKENNSSNVSSPVEKNQDFKDVVCLSPFSAAIKASQNRKRFTYEPPSVPSKLMPDKIPETRERSLELIRLRVKALKRSAFGAIETDRSPQPSFKSSNQILQPNCSRKLETEFQNLHPPSQRKLEEKKPVNDPPIDASSINPNISKVSTTKPVKVSSSKPPLDPSRFLARASARKANTQLSNNSSRLPSNFRWKKIPADSKHRYFWNKIELPIQVVTLF